MRFIYEHFGTWAFLMVFAALAFATCRAIIKGCDWCFPPETGEREGEPRDTPGALMDRIQDASEIEQRGIRDWLNQKFKERSSENTGSLA